MDGKYDILSKVKDTSGKWSKEVRTPFEIVTAPVNQAPVITSWDIQSNTKQPQLYINASDDVQVKEITLQLYDTSNVLAFTQTYTPNTKTAAINQKLDLGSVAKGNYTVKVKAKDDKGAESTVLEKMIEVPNSAPSIVGVPMLSYDNITKHWNLQVNATDIDGNGDYIKVKVLDWGGAVSEESSYKNTQNKISWTANDWFALADSGKYTFTAYVVDKNGAESQLYSKEFTQN
jgi:hypothetical protein